MILLNLQTQKTFPDKPGIYRIYAYKNKDQPMAIPRFCGIDPRGTLYIGQTSSQTIKLRLYNFLATIKQTGKTTNHSGGLKYKSNLIIKKILLEHSLYVEFEICEHPLKREKELLQAYSSTFGEYPPLNK